MTKRIFVAIYNHLNLFFNTIFVFYALYYSSNNYIKDFILYSLLRFTVYVVSVCKSQNESKNGKFVQLFLIFFDFLLSLFILISRDYTLTNEYNFLQVYVLMLGFNLIETDCAKNYKDGDLKKFGIYWLVVTLISCVIGLIDDSMEPIISAILVALTLLLTPEYVNSIFGIKIIESDKKSLIVLQMLIYFSISLLYLSNKVLEPLELYLKCNFLVNIQQKFIENSLLVIISGAFRIILMILSLLIFFVIYRKYSKHSQDWFIGTIGIFLEKEIFRVHFKKIPSNNVEQLGLWIWDDVELTSSEKGEWPVDGAISFKYAGFDKYGYYMDIKMQEENPEKISFLINNLSGENLTKDITVDLTRLNRHEVWLDENYNIKK